jgi:hypothetical protein
MLMEKETLYIVFGKHTEHVAGSLEKQGYKIVGSDRTLDAAAIMAPNLDEKPDTYLVLGSALVSGVVDVGINYGAALLDNLSKLRQAVPNSRIVLMLPEDVEPEVIQGIVYMGIYDIHKVKRISISQIPELLTQRKSYADYGVNTLPMPTKESGKSEIEIRDEEDKGKKRLNIKGLIAICHNFFGAFIARREERSKQKCLPAGVQNTENYKEDEEDIEDTRSIKVEDIKKQPVKKVLCLGLESSLFAGQEIEIVADPNDAQIVVSDINGFNYAPKDKNLIVIGTGTVADFAVKASRPDAYIAEDIEDALNIIKHYQKETPAKEKVSEKGVNKVEKKPEKIAQRVEKKPNLTVISSGRSGTSGHVLTFNSALYVVCPSRPNKSGEIAAKISKSIDNCALVCAAAGSMGAISLGIPAKDLICMDWRVPGSDAPVKWDGVLVWPVDPYKFLKINESPHGLIEKIKPKFSLVVVDCAGELDIVSRASIKDGIIVLFDETDSTISYWMKNYAGGNVFPSGVSETICIIPAENGFVLTKQDMQKASRVQG